MYQPISRQNSARLPILEIIGSFLILIAAILMVVQIGAFSRSRQNLPYGLSLGDVPTGGLSRVDAQAYLENAYGTPISVFYQDQEVRLEPSAVAFQVNSEQMLSEAEQTRIEGSTFWAEFWNYLWLKQEAVYSVPLSAEYSEDLLRAWVAELAQRYDRAPVSPEPVLETLSFENGQPGYTLDQEQAVELLHEVLMRPANRSVDLPITEVDAARADLDTLSQLIVDYLDAREFDGVASVHVIDLETGDEMELDVDLRSGDPVYLACEVAYASTSTMKIPIMVEYFRYLNWLPTPDSDQYTILYNTMVRSGNTSANFMMQDMAFGDARRAPLPITASMQYLGLQNTFIVAPYDDITPPEYYSTPAREAARSGACVDTYADPYMQTTVNDLAVILDLIYQCAEYGGGVAAVYPGEVTQEDCQMMLEIMAQNEEGVLIMAGVPQTTQVAHKHGWTYDTHGDAGIVFSEGGDYVLTLFLWQDTDWMDIRVSFPLIEGISEATFNYFNPDQVLTPRRGLSPLETGGAALPQ